MAIRDVFELVFADFRHASIEKAMQRLFWRVNSIDETTRNDIRAYLGKAGRIFLEEGDQAKATILYYVLYGGGSSADFQMQEEAVITQEQAKLINDTIAAAARTELSNQDYLAAAEKAKMISREIKRDHLLAEIVERAMDGNDLESAFMIIPSISSSNISMRDDLFGKIAAKQSCTEAVVALAQISHKSQHVSLFFSTLSSLLATHDLSNALELACSLPKGNERYLALSRIAGQLFPACNLTIEFDKANEIVDEAKGRAILDDLFASLQLAPPECSLKAAMQKLLAMANGNLSRAFDIANMLPAEGRRKDLFIAIAKIISPDDEVDELIVAFNSMEDSTERRQSLYEFFNK